MKFCAMAMCLRDDRRELCAYSRTTPSDGMTEVHFLVLTHFAKTIFGG